MAHSKISLFLGLVLYAAIMECKIVLPHKLRYLENMLNADFLTKTARMRQRIDGNPNIPESEKDWPSLLSKYQDEKPNDPAQPLPPLLMNSLYQRRMPNGQF